MIRVYLDWNIFSYLKTFKKSKEPYISLNRNLTENSNKILVPYTSAHLTDLISSYNQSEKGKKETEKDLKYLEELTNHLCILYDNKEQSTYPDKLNIQEYFHQLLDSEDLTKGNFENLFSSFSGTEFEGLTNSFLNLLKQLPSGFDNSNIEKLSPKFQPLKDAFQGNSMYDVLNSIFSLMSQYNTDPKTYRSLRNASLEQLRMTHDYSMADDPIRSISENLERSAIKKSFKEFADFNLKNYFKDKNPSRFDIFINHYILLDFLGFYKDKQFKNLIQDSFHSYYGSHCDFFVTDDDNTYNKAKVIYEYFNIETIVCKSDEFNSKFYGKVILNSHNERPIFKVISDILGSSFVITNKHDNEFNPADIYKVEHYVLNYFNRLQVTHNVNGTKTIYLYKKSKNYSSFLFFKEIETIVNRISIEFGIDKNNRLQYIPEIENQELIDKKWTGRFWQLKGAFIELQMREAPFGLTLTIDIKKNTRATPTCHRPCRKQN